MKKTLFATVVTLFVASALVAAQEPSPPPVASSENALSTEKPTDDSGPELPAPRQIQRKKLSNVGNSKSSEGFISTPVPPYPIVSMPALSQPPESGINGPMRKQWTGPAIAPGPSRPWTGGCVAPGADSWNDGCNPPTPFVCNNYMIWGGADALFWWEKKQPLPPDLITTGLPTDALPGALGQPNTQLVFGPNQIGYGLFTGIRLNGGIWLDPHQVIGGEVSGFVLGDRGQGLDLNSTTGGSPLLALRHFDAPGGAQDAFVITSPRVQGGAGGPFSGGVALQTNSQLWGIEENVLHALYWSNQFRLVVLAGMRYLDLAEGLSIQTKRMAGDSSSVNFLGHSFAAPGFELTTDAFHTHNQFYGGQTGLRGEYFFGRVFVRVGGLLALGRTDEVSNVLGVTTLQPKNAGPLSAPGGLYALPSNSGRLLNQEFGIIPEVQLKGGVFLTPCLRATFGYNFLYWSNVLRPGNQIDLTVDTRQVPTSPAFQAGAAATSPRPLTNASDFWVQGLTLGLEFTF